MRSLLLAAAALSLNACWSFGPTPTPTPSPNDRAVDIFVTAASEIPDQTFFGVWVAPSRMVAGHGLETTYDASAYIVGGNADAVEDPMAGRLLTYEEGTMQTVCVRPHALYAVAGDGHAVFAAGASGEFLRYDPATHGCETIALPPEYQSVEIRGISPDASTQSMYLVGTNTSSSAPTGVILRYDGTTVTSVTLPDDGATPSLRGIFFDGAGGHYAVGDHGTVLQRAEGADTWTHNASLPAGFDDSLYAITTETVSTDHWTMVVGGASSTAMLAHSAVRNQWEPRTSSENSSGGLRGVYAAGNREVYFVGLAGTQFEFNGSTFYRAVPNVTADLFAVHGADGLVIAVGGDTTNHTAVLLVRGDAHPTYTIDGTSHTARGTERQAFASDSSHSFQ